MGSFKIKSKFYVIIGDNKPIYVGYTNRTIKQRFREHLRDKDFSDYDNVKAVELNAYEKYFSFTWDYLIVQEDASIVNNIERQLINKYDTQDSIYQKAIGGGQNWANIKHFVLCNKGNPKFEGLSGDEIKKYISNRREYMRFLNSFVINMIFPEETFLHIFVSDMIPSEKRCLKGFVGSMVSLEELVLNSFVSDMISPEEIVLKGFVGNMKTLEEGFLSSFIGNMKAPEEKSLDNFTSNMIFTKERYLLSFVYNMKERKTKND